MPLVIPADPELVVVNFIHDELIPSLSDLTGWTVSTRVPDGQTPRRHIGVRSVGGSDEQFVADRYRIDVRVWADGTVSTEVERSRVARMLLAHLRRRFRARLFASPVPLPDPVDPTKTLTLFTIELLLKGTQAP